MANNIFIRAGMAILLAIFASPTVMAATCQNAAFPTPVCLTNTEKLIYADPTSGTATGFNCPLYNGKAYPLCSSVPVNDLNANHENTAYLAKHLRKTGA